MKGYSKTKKELSISKSTNKFTAIDYIHWAETELEFNDYGEAIQHLESAIKLLTVLTHYEK